MSDPEEVDPDQLSLDDWLADNAAELHLLPLWPTQRTEDVDTGGLL